MLEPLNHSDRCQSDGAHLIMLYTAKKLQDFLFLPTGKCADKMYTYLGDVDLCVKVYSDGRNSTDAADKCRSDGGHLITLDTAEKLHAFSEFATKYTAYHIGLEKIEGRWEWTRDSTLVFDPSLWNANEPNGQSASPPELCGAFFRGSDINGMPGVADVPCCIPFHFVCEL
eukprot:XP_011425005.1 PREDICTED: C-type lectin domain family 4 member E [Crassostrea gigas]